MCNSSPTDVFVKIMHSIISCSLHYISCWGLVNDDRIFKSCSENIKFKHLHIVCVCVCVCVCFSSRACRVIWPPDGEKWACVDFLHEGWEMTMNGRWSFNTLAVIFILLSTAGKTRSNRYWLHNCFTLEHNLSQARALRSHDLDVLQNESQF